ncbi:hypothetical protein BU23DRAFT_512686 [Bimuria novae-zelandiae CBS 107.79]|uniref:Acid protease n=1 Tax=Bimuria novae-zelandiae CBS 107.79 TaxID=1447943 RepID=A0A6A5V427_9PLEO|nr:hypothetical protein BU23DRAFT_512686 [Bimuria novae-zelandiae CBS 107.79]
MASLAFYLSATVLFAQSTVAFNCSIAPIYVDIHKRAVHDSTVFQYGSFIGVGIPAQNHSLWPSLSQNQTSFGARTFCDDGNSTLRDCNISTGGFFSSQDSTTFVENENYETLDTAGNSTFDKSYFGRDTLHLYTHYFETDGASQTNVENYTVEVVEEGSTKPAVVGIGASSSVLRDLAAINKICAKTYSLYIGQGFDRAGGAVNGSNVFGGYDAGRFVDPVHKYSMTSAGMSVRVKDIIISETNDAKSNVSLFENSDDAFDAQITTDQYPLSLPYEITQKFISQLDAEEDNTWGDNSLKLRKPFNGSMTMVLDDGFEVTLPSSVLMNASNITPIQSRSKDSKAPFYLSTAFLTQVYLMADFEKQSFFLATAVQKNNMVMPTPFCPGSTPTAYQRPNQNAFLKQGLIGAVIGGILGAVGIGICAYCFVASCRRKVAERRIERRIQESQKAAKMAQFEVEEVMEFDPPPKSATPFFWRKT